jgi:hypothetical protein
MFRSRFALALVGLLVAAAPAVAQPAEGGVVKKEGEYGGITPGQAQPPEQGKKRRAPARKTLAWLGFTPKEGGSSELFFAAIDTFTVSQRMDGATLVIVLEGLTKQARNTRRPLDTRFFDVAVARVTSKVVRAKRARRGAAGHPGGVEVRVRFKDAKDAREGTLRTDKGADGMFYAYLSFSPPSTPGQIPDAVDRPSSISTTPPAEMTD